MKAISLKQPWAWLIVNGHKNIENRNWNSSFRGPVLIHASKTWDEEAFPKRPGLGASPLFSLPPNLPFPSDMSHHIHSYEMGGIIGIATFVGCITKSDNPWFFGKYGFLLEDARPLPFMPLRGQLGFFDVPEEIVDRYRKGE